MLIIKQQQAATQLLLLFLIYFYFIFIFTGILVLELRNLEQEWKDRILVGVKRKPVPNESATGQLIICETKLA